jgi:hypothetical protein
MAKRGVCFDPTDPAGIPAEQRLTEVCAILAAGVIRMREGPKATEPRIRPYRNLVRGARPPKRGSTPFMPEKSRKSDEGRLEVSRGSRPDGQRG